MALLRQALVAAFAVAPFCVTVCSAADPPGRNLAQHVGVATRYDVAEIDAMDELDPYRVTMLLAWQELTTDPHINHPLSYWRLAGIHGKNWAYDGTPPPTQGFCRHQSPGFGAWHRAYLRQFELGMIAAAERAAARFKDPALQKQYTAMAQRIRIPYWDWTNATIPQILLLPRVTVLGTDGQPTRIRNPFSSYTFVGAAGDGRSEGRTLRRGSQWAQTMSRSSRRFGMEMASFLRSNTWRCTYLTGIGCAGNLESTHNEIHNILGGTAGEMATVPYAGFDPLFWLHHCMVDRVLWLYQNNGGLWGGASSYSPFQGLGGDVAQIASLGYTYSAGRPIVGRASDDDLIRRRRRPWLRAASDEAMDMDMDMDDEAELDAVVGGGGGRAARIATTGGTVNSRGGKAAVQYALEQWTRNYTGYAWSLRLQEFDQHQMDKAVHIYVYLNKHGGAHGSSGNGSSGVVAMDALTDSLPARVTMLEDFNELRLRPNYCGSVAGFNEHIHAADANHILSRAVDLTECLQRAGIATDVPPAHPDRPQRGPSTTPVRMRDLRLVALTADGEDVSDRFNFGRPVVSWALPVTRTAGAVRAVTASASAVDAAAYASPTLFPPDQEVFGLAQGIVRE